MNILPFISFFAFIISIIMGLNIFINNYRNRANLIFFFMCLSISIWALGSLFVFSTTNEYFFPLYLKIGFVGVLSFFALTLHFSLEISNLIKIKYYYLIIIYAIPIILLIMNIFFDIPILYEKIIYQKGLYLFIQTPNRFLYFLYGLIANLYVGLSFIILIIWGVKTKINKQRSQSRILSISLLISLILAMSDEFYIPYILKHHQSHGTAVIYTLIWITGIWYSIVKYSFLSITPQFVAKEVISSIDESIMILNQDYKIIKANHKIEEILNLKEDKLLHSSINKILLNSDRIKIEIEKMIIEKIENFSCRTSFIKDENISILMDIKISIIKDKFDDLIGFLIVGKEVKELKQLKSYYKITDREVEVIQYVIYGLTNKEIAVKIGSTEATVKVHFNHIFDKTRVDNIVQLINFLNDFNLIPDQNTEKIIIL